VRQHRHTLAALPKSSVRMSVMNNIYRKMGKESIKLASEGFTRPWKMKQGNKSPTNTTKWNAIKTTAIRINQS